MMRFVKSNWPVLAAVGLLWITVIVLCILSIKRNHGHFVYALDDPYIHMAMAKNFVRHGVWGITRYEFSSSSSSILWTLLLSFSSLLSGEHEATPFILNLILATLLIVAAHIFLKKHCITSSYEFLLLLCVTFLTPLPSLIFSGMEHTAQTLINVVFVFVSARLLSRESIRLREHDSLLLLALAPFVPLIRYEGLFLIGVVCGLMILRRRQVFYSFALGVLAIAPISLYGLISIRHGGLWLPNSVALKGVAPLEGIAHLFQRTLVQLWAAPHLLALLLLALTIYFIRRRRRKTTWEDGQLLLIIFLLTTILHVMFAAVGWFYRYEAYLVALGVILNGALLREALPTLTPEQDGKSSWRLVAAVLLISFAATLLVNRGLKSLVETPQATSNIYEQQYQMGLFLRDNYQGKAIAANDIGAINVLADIKCLDLWGLGNIEVTRAKLEKSYDTQKIYELGEIREVKIAIVYDGWYIPYGGLPSQWVAIGRWKIFNCVVCGGDVVTFYAVDPAEAAVLARNLRAFAARLPLNVEQTGIYTRSESESPPSP